MELNDFGDRTEILTNKQLNEGRGKTEPRSEETEHEERKLKKDQWSIVGSGMYLPSSLTVKNLPAGVYLFRETNMGMIVHSSPSSSDELISFPDSIYQDVEKEVDKFWDIGNEFKKYGFLHRRGYLFYGPAGSGKSCLVQRIIKNVIEKNGLIFICSMQPRIASDGLRMFREVEPDRKVACIFEDIDAIIENYGESDVLMLLDGENQVDKVINIATTNYPERLDKRIVARPRRFDRIIKIAMPGSEIRRIFFEKKLGLNGEDIEKWVEKSEGLSFASLSELVISVKCLGNSFEGSIKKLIEIETKKVSSREFETSNLGFLQS